MCRMPKQDRRGVAVRDAGAFTGTAYLVGLKRVHRKRRIAKKWVKWFAMEESAWVISWPTLDARGQRRIRDIDATINRFLRHIRSVVEVGATIGEAYEADGFSHS